MNAYLSQISFQSRVVCFALCLSLLLTTLSAHADGGPRVPEDLDAFLVFMANGTIPAGEPLLIPGTDFQTEVMGRTVAEIEALRQDAIDFIAERFGLDVEQLVADERATFGPFTTSSLFNYRAHVVRGFPHRRTPKRGFEIREGTFIMFITDPDGIELGGEFAGVSVPVGTAIGTGEYNIKLSRHRELVIAFQSLAPAIPGNQQLCEIFHPDKGRGLAIVSSFFQTNAFGDFTVNARNVLTFPFPQGPIVDE